MDEQELERWIRDAKEAQKLHKNAFYSLLLYDAAKRSRRRNIISFVAEGSFRGNTKYAFIGISDAFRQRGIDCEVHWIGGKEDKAQLESYGYTAHTLGKPWEGTDKLLHSKAVIYGNFDWASEKSYERQLCAAGARRIYLGHGVPAKKIGYAQIATRGNFFSFAGMAHETLGYTDIISESAELEHTYIEAFPTADVHHLGSARNDLFATVHELPPVLLYGLETANYSAVRDARRDGKKVVFYAPTYREKAQGLHSFMQAVHQFYNSIESNNEWFVIAKYHPGFRGYASSDVEPLYQPRSNVLLLADREDINPYLRETDILITDYSSVYYDYLLLDRPIVFFQPDRAEYEAARVRNFYSIADNLEIGPICEDPRQMSAILTGELADASRCSADRRRFARFLHQHGNDGRSVERLADFLISSLDLDHKGDRSNHAFRLTPSLPRPGKRLTYGQRLRRLWRDICQSNGSAA